MKRTFEYVEGASTRFWNIELAGPRTIVSFGRVGGKGQTRERRFADEAAANRECEKLVREKLRKGYKETTPVSSPLREALEEAIFESPDDVASHAAYADYLQEQGDPRGEFIQVQLALEDEKLAAE